MAKYTRERIIDAFFELAIKNPEKTGFTMSEIAKEAGLTRQAIYRKHFRNFQEIVDYVYQFLDKQMYQVCSDYDIEQDGNPFDYIADRLLPVIYEKRKWVSCLYISAIAPSFEQFVVSTYTEWGIKNMHPSSEKFHLSDDVLIRLIVEQTTTIIKNWIIQENPLPPEDFKKVFLKLVKESLYDYLITELPTEQQSISENE
ncbi:TetR/AcrR family transcriptional regulator [Streptococcus ruminantium]|uniref:TetR/AcrR family transcriptional regulator n=1 Tax=Streptococcus ruminantium TaxID=1917441 RepID=A0ABU1B2P0_9STRE|nr:TetR/AcrR family transcriptional regulator [Streptococcus ruminantium]MDQ8759200.1 TetR/AcrR family transcriptional regulator [Streptococcus ruminantium]MDQ8764251.1 TetR/AcrR family transcriptional regulator [Streptococcus ruminantium]MDQ8766455.1 TetR/AcrR family transcriptional regulator [Streptococcus ruminantium]MDQ8769027.1 TetR/AcrR family transcriptional regulator [Streptococcus ruminantium]MDQ8774419.1 TetR/AcrR family transcriptional regulator [Streptococcus ruminantium]